MAGVNWLRWELSSVIVFHGGLALIILAAPDKMVVTGATWAIFYYTGRLGMGLLFGACALLAALCLVRPRPLLQLGCWVLVYMLGAGWLCGFILAIQHGSGGLYGVIVWSTLLCLWASTAVRLGLGSGDTSVVDRSR